MKENKSDSKYEISVLKTINTGIPPNWDDPNWYNNDESLITM